MSSSYEAEVQKFKAELQAKLLKRSSKRKRPEVKKYVLDVDILECPICSEPFSPPVFQCDNGHTACSSCCQKMITKGCPSCSLPIGRIRCLAIEKIIESLWVECEHGCAIALKFHERDEHEENLCTYRSVKCPTVGCSHRGLIYAISEHLVKEHDIITVEWCESTRSASFHMRQYKETAVLVKAREAWLLVSLFSTVGALVHVFTCKSVWVSKKVVFKLTVKANPQMYQEVYSMESAVSPGDLQQRKLNFHGYASLFDVTVSLIH